MTKNGRHEVLALVAEHGKERAEAMILEDVLSSPNVQRDKSVARGAYVRIGDDGGLTFGNLALIGRGRVSLYGGPATSEIVAQDGIASELKTWQARKLTGAFA